MELRCTRDLALALGAIKPINVAHHRMLKAEDMLMVRDQYCAPMFWVWQMSRLTRMAEMTGATPRSS